MLCVVCMCMCFLVFMIVCQHANFWTGIFSRYTSLCDSVYVFICICVWTRSLRAKVEMGFAGTRASLHGHISVMCEMARKVKAGN